MEKLNFPLDSQRLLSVGGKILPLGREVPWFLVIQIDVLLGFFLFVYFFF